MIEFGKSLRTAREAKGLSLSQVANMTHMLIQIVEGLEKEDFSQIVAPIYGRGFVKLYCEAVGLEPKPFIDEFMALYNNPKAKSPKSEPTPPAPTPAPPPPPSEMRATRGSRHRRFRPNSTSRQRRRRPPLVSPRRCRLTTMRILSRF